MTSTPAATDAPPPPPELRDIRGPSAFGGSLRRFLDLLWLMSVTEFRTRYVGSSLGYGWTLLRPLVFFGVIFIVLRGLIGFGARTEHYAAMLVLNIILFQYFSDSTNRAVRSVSARENMVRKMQFPRIVIPLSVSLTGGFTLVLNLIAGLALVMLTGVEPRASWLLLPVVVLLLALLTTGVSLPLSVLFVRSEDVAEVWSLISRMLFYMSPVLYPLELVPHAVRPFVMLNPLAPLLVEARKWVIDPRAPGALEAAGSAVGLAIPIVLSVLACVLGLWLFEREAPRVAEAV